MTKLLACIALAVPLAVYAADPAVENVVASQRVGTNLVDISYDLHDPDTPALIVSMAVSTNAGATFDAACPSALGDIGTYVLTGANKHIEWNGGRDLPGVATSQLCVRVTADDERMALIPAGPFAMGNCMSTNEGYAHELPVHTVAISAFHIDKHEVSYALWSNVYAWAIAHGYTFNNEGAGRTDNHPVHTVNWYDCVKWCNARSEKEGRVPCYYSNAAQTQIYRIGQISLTNDFVKWVANGYRLPTEAEWEKAARGGAPGHRFPWNDSEEIQHVRANYNSINSLPYDTSPTAGYHPTFNIYSPCTSPVGYFAPNAYGLYDMEGNLLEWCWDWYDGGWYSNTVASQSDTRGPAGGGSYCLMRGGGWYLDASASRCAFRYPNIPSGAAHTAGFRCARGLDAPSAMALIPAGSFAMGDTFAEGGAEELPVHTVMVSAFYIDRHEVSFTLWSNVHAWAVTHGYSFDNAGTGKAPNHPVQTVNWYDCVKWCNARSEREGRMPCYFLDAAQTVVYRTGQSNIWNDVVNWSANGYRLPTEAEWEKAARGGTPGHRFPWSDADTISHTRANYNAYTNQYTYDISATPDYHPMFAVGGYAYTSLMGYFAPNGYGLHDMAGNVWEWTWDWHDSVWYGTTGATQNDTHGPTNGEYRVARGGCWTDYARYSRCAVRIGLTSAFHRFDFGFRCARRLDTSDMALIPAGPFAMGDTFSEGGPHEVPVHAVSVSAFYMDTCEVSYTLWSNVYSWATANGYSFDNTGACRAASHPVHTINWYDCVKWCNARSEKEGLTPCYYTDSAQTQIYRIGQIDLINQSVNWSTNGYRLPTEAEWEKAARGGTPGHRFPWSDADTIQHARANYLSSTNADGSAKYAYDTSPTRGWHPTFASGPSYTSPVGYFAPNGYGLYDMAGNVVEWTWDWYDDAWYTNASAAHSNTRGPTSGMSRVVRGGTWYDEARLSRCACRVGYPSYGAEYLNGFRCVKATDFTGDSTYTSPPCLFNTRAPDAPVNISPAAGTTNQPQSPTLESSAFSDPFDTHTASQWQVATNSGFTTILYDSGIATNLLILNPEPCILNPSARFFWRVRHLDNHGQWSAWSMATWFETTAGSQTDCVAVPAGPFTMGDPFDEGTSDELPLHDVYVSAFYIDKTEVSYMLWTNVYAWAVSNGYAFDHSGMGKETNHPLHTVNWYDCVKWCNARSENEGRIPCYYTSALRTDVYRSGQIDLGNDCVKWSADGYRLPTEAEWEKAARGGVVGHRFPWSDADTISHDRANYQANTNAFAYDASSTQGYHPTFATGPLPYTSPACYFMPNGYDLYEMGGNVPEWTWDRYSSTWYSNVGATQNDTRGPASGTTRVLRGGSWNFNAYYSRCARRTSYVPNHSYWESTFGFRCARGLGITNAPFVTITNTPQTLSFDTTTFAVAGTNNSDVVGGMWVSNSANGMAAPFPASPSWTAPVLSLAVGTNVISACGSNVVGMIASDSLVVMRAASAAAAVVVSPTYLDFATNGTAKSFTIANAGGGSFSFAATVTGGTWLTVQPGSGVVSNQMALVVASANRTGMVDGIHTAFISVTPSVGAGVVVTCRMVVAGNSVIAIAGGPYYADQGTAVTLDGSASLGNNLQYRWEIVGQWISPSHSAANVRTNVTCYIPGTNDVILYVKETGSMTTYGDQTILVIRNVAPVVDIGGPYTGTVNQTVALRATIADPGTGDTHEVRWDFGAGWSPWQAAGAVALTGAVFASGGSHAVQCEVRDNYGAVGADMATVFVDAPNLPPTARATLGSPGVVFSNYFGMHMTVLLDGSGSVDDRTASSNLFFDWREDVDNPSKPLLSDAARQQSNAVITFMPLPGTYKFHLVVNDGEYNSEAATVQANIPGMAGIVKSDGIGAVLPLCGVTLTATNQALGQVFSCVSDYEGKYALDTGAGNGRMVVMERNGQVHQALANVDSDGMRNYVLTFAPNVGSFSALVNSGYYGGAYAPIPGAYAQVVIGSDVAFSGVGDLSGVVPFGGVPELWPRNNPSYNYQVLYQKPGWESAVQALQVDPAMPEAQYPTLDPSDACTIQGSVVGTNGMPVRGIEVSFGPAFASVYTDQQGAFVANGMMRGEYFVRLSASDFETTYRTINVPPGDTNYLVPPLYVRGGRFSVYGEVFNGENGMPIYNAQVRVVSSTKRGTVGMLATTSSVASTRSGYYDLPVAKGARTIVIEASGYEPKTVPVDAQGHVQQPVQLVPVPEPAAVAAALFAIGYAIFVRRREGR